MKEIDGFYHISNVNATIFYYDTNAAINLLQKHNQEVEVQYSSAPLGNQILYSAIILGRKPKEATTNA